MPPPRMFPEDHGPRNAALLAIDRVDANVHAVAGGVLNDDSLRDDAAHRRAAADERQRAVALHARADEQKRQADALLTEDLARSEQFREAAARESRTATAGARCRHCSGEARGRGGGCRAGECSRRGAGEELAATESKAKRERLKALDEQTAALDQQTDALTASDEAQRLAKAALEAKAARKGTA